MRRAPILVVAAAIAVCSAPDSARAQTWRAGTAVGGGIIEGGGATVNAGIWTQWELRHLGLRAELAVARTGIARFFRDCLTDEICLGQPAEGRDWQMELPLLLSVPLPVTNAFLVAGIAPNWRLSCEVWLASRPVTCSRIGIEVPFGFSYRPGPRSAVSFDIRGQVGITPFVVAEGNPTYRPRAWRIWLGLAYALWYR